MFDLPMLRNIAADASLSAPDSGMKPGGVFPARPIRLGGGEGGGATGGVGGPAAVPGARPVGYSTPDFRPLGRR